VGADLGQELARRLGVPFVPVAYPNGPAAVDGARAGQVDAVVLGVDPSRAAEFDAVPYLGVDMTYLVPAASPIRTAADADRPGVRIAAPPGSVYQLTLERQLRAAELVGLGRPDAFPAMEAGTLHAIAFEGPTLAADAAERPGFRVVDGRFGVVEHGVLLLKGRPAALAFVTEVVEQAKGSGLVQQAIERAGLQGVQVAPPAARRGPAQRPRALPRTGAAGPVLPFGLAAGAGLLLFGLGLTAATAVAGRAKAA
jgi:polar amino acid transport system substrate-binding protein